MLKRLLPLLLFAASPAFAAEAHFRVASERFGYDDILDARAQPELDGTSSIRITFSEPAAKRIATLTQGLVGKPAHIAYDQETIADPVVREPILGGVLTISGQWTLENATALAKKISGKDPLPDSLDDESF